MTQIVRQTFRGRRWYVLHDPIADGYHRISAPAYRFIGLLDSQRTIEEAWRICAERDGDEAPTQGEAIRVLGQLAAANLLRGDWPVDADAVMRRAAKRRGAERKGRLQSFLFVRIPFWDPDRWLERLAPVMALVWCRAALVPWCLLLFTGLWYVVPRIDRLYVEAGSVLETNNLLLLYGAFVLAKLVHELAHATSCKALLYKAGLRGGVHQIGVMLLVMIPMPYVDASSATALPQKTHRVVVASAGMIAELALASGAAITWALTAPESTLHVFSYNLMFVGSISTLVFNINPLLRYDGYYILSDLLGIANLAQRSRETVMHIVKRHAWGIRSASLPTRERGEAFILMTYGVASSVYRVAVLLGIIFFVSKQLFVVGLVLAIAAMVIWLVWPVCRFLMYLTTSHELASHRSRAVFSSAGVAALFSVLVAGVPMPNSLTLSAVVEPVEWEVVRAHEDGIVLHVADHGPINSDEVVLVELSNSILHARYNALDARVTQARFQAILAESRAPVAAAVAEDRLASIQGAYTHTARQIDSLVVRAPYPGTWEPEEEQLSEGAYLRRGQVIGTFANLERYVLVSHTDQEAVASMTVSESVAGLCRAIAVPQSEFHAALKSIASAVDTEKDQESREPGFILQFEPEDRAVLRPGQTVLIRVALPRRPLLGRLRDWYIKTIGSEINV